MRAGVPCGNVKFDDAIAWDSKRGNSRKLWASPIGEVVWWRYRDKPFLTLQRPQTLGDAPMSRHLEKNKPFFLQAHDPYPRRAVGKSQAWLFSAGLRIGMFFVNLCPRRSWKDDFAIGREGF